MSRNRLERSRGGCFFGNRAAPRRPRSPSFPRLGGRPVCRTKSPPRENVRRTSPSSSARSSSPQRSPARIRQGRIAHAYLFAGPRGVGKTSVARILARALNCEKGPTDTPCGVCASCREIARGASLDVIEIDGASNTSVNDVREIRDEVLFAPNAGRYKVYIIDEVHMLSNSAFNALLKTIEEPPPYIVFIFATTEVHKVPATIRSRCQQYNFRLISTGEIKEKLREASKELGVEAEERALIWIAKEATGSLRDAYTLLDQVVSFSEGAITLERIREKLGVLGIDELNDFARLLRAGDVGQGAGAHGRDPGERGLHRAVRRQPRRIFPQPAVPEERHREGHPAGLRAGGFRRGSAGVPDAPRRSRRPSSCSLSLYRNIRFSLNQRFELELLLSRLAQLDSADQPCRGPRRAAGNEGRAARGVRGHDRRSRAPRLRRLDEEIRSIRARALKKIAEALRREKPALASALDKVSRVSLGGRRAGAELLRQGQIPGGCRSEGQGHARRPVLALSFPGAARIRLAFQ